MAFPIKTCVLCGEEFELRPNKPGYANRCPECSTPEAEAEATSKGAASGFQGKALAEIGMATPSAARGHARHALPQGRS